MFRLPYSQVSIQDSSARIAGDLHSAAYTGGRGDPSSFRGGPQIAGIDLVAMLVSDSGLASTEPVWWNTSPMGCCLLGLQPRGGWQIMQRTVQWGQDRIAKAFGVNCTKPLVYAYFTCNIRNRIEVWDSVRWHSPMQDQEETRGWMKTQRSTVTRPTKLIDGSRGGQAFMCEMLLPKENDHYNIEQQARMQMLSVLLVAASRLQDQSLENLKNAFREDFDITHRLSSIFGRMKVYIAIGHVLMVLALLSIAYHFFHRSIFGVMTPYMIEISSITCWAFGAIGLLMQGGNPRVELAQEPMPAHVQKRYEDLLHELQLGTVEETYSSEEKPGVQKTFTTTQEIITPPTAPTVPYSARGHVKIQFGSLHGSVYLADKGYTYISSELVEYVCTRKLVLCRPWQWYTSVVWCAFLLAISIALQIVGTRTANTGSVIVGVIVLLGTSVMRGSGISGPEEWQVPGWKRRKGTSYGATLQGSLGSR